MVSDILPSLVQRLQSKAEDYGNVFMELGLGGQYSDMHRKMHKLKQAMWEGKHLKGEQPDEILSDLFGNILISLYLYGYGETDQRPAGAQSFSGQDTDAQRASTGRAKGGKRQQTADEVRLSPPSFDV